MHERDANGIDATFDTTYADTPTTGRYSLELQNGDDRRLVMREHGADANADPVTYLPCPEGS